jgi:hypothetical protein
MQLGHLGIKGCLLTSELVMVLSYPPLGIDLAAMGLRLLHLLVGLLLIREELHF